MYPTQNIRKNVPLGENTCSLWFSMSETFPSSLQTLTHWPLSAEKHCTRWFRRSVAKTTDSWPIEDQPAAVAQKILDHYLPHPYCVYQYQHRNCQWTDHECVRVQMSRYNHLLQLLRDTLCDHIRSYIWTANKVVSLSKNWLTMRTLSFNHYSDAFAILASFIKKWFRAQHYKWLLSSCLLNL